MICVSIGDLFWFPKVPKVLILVIVFPQLYMGFLEVNYVLLTEGGLFD